jgi:AraC-like DNA-binding protein/quercetin dioxygenase-like cupin family protein
MMQIREKNTLQKSSMLGISMKFETIPGGYDPLHYHDAVEILYPLNGDMELTIDGQKQKLTKKNLTVIETGQIHHTYSRDKYSMLACIHISKKHLQSYLPDIELHRISCNPALIRDEDFPKYLNICLLLSDLTRLYMTDAPMFHLEADGLVLQIMAKLLRDFSVPTTPQMPSASQTSMERIREVINYVQENFREPITLTDLSERLGIDKAYFCRFFKQNMGISFLHYLNEVRLSHAYLDLLETNLPVADIMEQNGLSNQKLFNRSFKELYGCTPSAVRKHASNEAETK